MYVILDVIYNHSGNNWSISRTEEKPSAYPIGTNRPMNFTVGEKAMDRVSLAHLPLMTPYGQRNFRIPIGIREQGRSESGIPRPGRILNIRTMSFVGEIFSI
jgi:hypothetical protein